jgi:hypothetical protein
VCAGVFGPTLTTRVGRPAGGIVRGGAVARDVRLVGDDTAAAAPDLHHLARERQAGARPAARRRGRRGAVL